MSDLRSWLREEAEAVVPSTRVDPAAAWDSAVRRRARHRRTRLVVALAAAVTLLVSLAGVRLADRAAVPPGDPEPSPTMVTGPTPAQIQGLPLASTALARSFTALAQEPAPAPAPLVATAALVTTGGAYRDLWLLDPDGRWVTTYPAGFALYPNVDAVGNIVSLLPPGALAPDGHAIVISQPGALEIIDLRTYEAHRHEHGRVHDPPSGAVWGPDGQLGVTIDGLTRVWEDPLDDGSQPEETSGSIVGFDGADPHLESGALSDSLSSGYVVTGSQVAWIEAGPTLVVLDMASEEQQEVRLPGDGGTARDGSCCAVVGWSDSDHVVVTEPGVGLWAWNTATMGVELISRMEIPDFSVVPAP